MSKLSATKPVYMVIHIRHNQDALAHIYTPQFAKKVLLIITSSIIQDLKCNKNGEDE